MKKTYRVPVEFSAADDVEAVAIADELTIGDLVRSIGLRIVREELTRKYESWAPVRRPEPTPE